LDKAELVDAVAKGTGITKPEPPPKKEEKKKGQQMIKGESTAS